jgi:YVTN family beta-propeller protein
VQTDDTGLYEVANAVVPDPWDLFIFTQIGCGYGNYYDGTITYNGIQYTEYAFPDLTVNPSTTQPIDCVQSSNIIPTAKPRFAIAGSLPSTITVGSEIPLTTQNGMPLLYFYDQAVGTVNIAATETATSVASGGMSATFPFPSTLTQNGYSLAVVNRTSSAPGYSPAGTNLLSIASSQTIAGNPFGVSVGAQTVSSTLCINSTCSSSSSYITFPVVTLYSSGEVLINGTPVTVGSNPTAVSTYPAGSISQVTNPASGEQLTTITSGTTRAIVANSGSNTVSVLDIVHDVVLFNVTVGNQPVALAVSSNGSTAYVANYTDSTVTQVNLNSGTATATIAVGGHPTSVALTAAGTLWVGGVGFLTKMNTQPMSVVATEPVTNKTIVALGFSDSVNQLVATTVDTSGNVYVDEVNPSTVTAGGAYTPLASSLVSSLGTHLNRADSEVRAYTATLASASLINTNQVGAPPLVVQDGWAVITATPTGFTITDITGYVVLVSEQTPSPVTAIAVDSNLNVAYLVMPDSNILLTVPLPGTNSTSSPVTMTTATPSLSGLTVTLNGGEPPSSVTYTFTLEDSTPGATIYYSITSCGSTVGAASSGQQTSYTSYPPDLTCNPSGTMYATAPGYAQSATTSLDL